MRATVEGVALTSGTQAEVRYVRYYPATVNTAAEAALALAAATAVGLQAEMAPRAAFTSEDFAFMLKHRPGAYLWLGQGRADPGPDGERALHHPCCDFNDDALALGVRWLRQLARGEVDLMLEGSPRTTAPKPMTACCCSASRRSWWCARRIRCSSASR
jgi:hippurate hydrolase